MLGWLVCSGSAQDTLVTFTQAKMKNFLRWVHKVCVPKNQQSIHQAGERGALLAATSWAQVADTLLLVHEEIFEENLIRDSGDSAKHFD